MASVTLLLASVASGESAGNEPLSANPWVPRLLLAEQVLWTAGGVLALIGIAVWLRRGRRNPLADIPQRPNRLLPEHLIAVLLVFLCILTLMQSALTLLPEGMELRLTSGTAAQLLGALVCLLVAARSFDGGLGRFVFGQGRSSRQVIEGTVLFCVALPLCNLIYNATTALLQHLDPGFTMHEHAVIDALREHSEPAWALWIGAVVVAPVAEELFFRGLLQTFLRNVTNRPWVAVAVAGAVFGIAHNPQPHAVPTIAALGVILGVTYERTGSLVAPITLHVLFNAKTMIWEGLAPGGG